MPQGIELEVLTGRDLALTARIPDLARLRITVFREYPYLYDGSLAYEEEYLATYPACPDSVVVLARAGTAVVGASTGLPLRAKTEAFQRPFVAQGFDPARVFYCGESVLLPAYRGRGVYRDFFSAREGQALALGGFEWMALCAVVRPDSHPRRPADYVPLDAIWEKFGYRKVSTLTTRYSWKDLDDTTASEKEMVFWLKHLS
jgi:GNAT superfamily N-acetyltransferase